MTQTPNIKEEIKKAVEDKNKIYDEIYSDEDIKIDLGSIRDPKPTPKSIKKPEPKVIDIKAPLIGELNQALRLAQNKGFKKIQTHINKALELAQQLD